MQRRACDPQPQEAQGLVGGWWGAQGCAALKQTFHSGPGDDCPHVPSVSTPKYTGLSCASQEAVFISLLTAVSKVVSEGQKNKPVKELPKS